ALVTRPRLLLLDEPMSNLDVGLRGQLLEELRSLQSRLSITTVYVTHARAEAEALTARIVQMEAGRIAC
ncbi:MAG: ABC transporter ATP-binding protein, partial [Blastocatellia bacterium]